MPCNGFRYMLIANNLEIINPTGINPVLLGFIFGIVGGILYHILISSGHWCSYSVILDYKTGAA